MLVILVFKQNPIQPFHAGETFPDAWCFKYTMKKFITLLVATASAVAFTAVAENYSTEATITPHKDKDTYEVVAVISQLVEKDGKQTEQVISRPRITSAPGVPASLYSGRTPKDSDYQTTDNFSMDVSWPKAGEKGVAFCTVTIKRGDKLVSKSKFQLKLDDK
jgi:hypothetical protein